jgi:hypothetical protein
MASFCRIKPTSADKAGGKDSGKRITAWDEATGRVEMGAAAYEHARAAIGPDTPQARAYEVIAQPLVQKWLEGYDADLLSYGQTGAGKTFTMFGPPFSMARVSDSPP